FCIANHLLFIKSFIVSLISFSFRPVHAFSSSKEGDSPFLLSFWTIVINLRSKSDKFLPVSYSKSTYFASFSSCFSRNFSQFLFSQYGIPLTVISGLGIIPLFKYT